MGSKKAKKPKVVDLDKDVQFTRPDDEVVKAFNNFWKPLVCDKRGRLVKNAIMRELFDYSRMMDNVPRVYDHVSGGKVSKPNTDADVVKALADERLDKAVEDALDEAWGYHEQELESLHERIRELETQLAGAVPATEMDDATTERVLGAEDLIEEVDDTFSVTLTGGFGVGVYGMYAVLPDQKRVWALYNACSSPPEFLASSAIPADWYDALLLACGEVHKKAGK